MLFMATSDGTRYRGVAGSDGRSNVIPVLKADMQNRVEGRETHGCSATTVRGRPRSSGPRPQQRETFEKRVHAE
jgi:hypothetical protein